MSSRDGPAHAAQIARLAEGFLEAAWQHCDVHFPLRNFRNRKLATVMSVSPRTVDSWVANA